MENPFASMSASLEFTPLDDIAEFHEKFGLHQPKAKIELHKEEWRLRHSRLVEEIDEYIVCVEQGDDAGTLDALVDLVYIALGTAYRRGWDFSEAWRRVHKANMAKERGKPNNSKYGSGFDIVKPEGWQGPSHEDLV